MFRTAKSVGAMLRYANTVFDVRGLTLESRGANESVIRGLTTNAYLGDHLSLCRVLGRYKMYVDTRDVAISSHLLLDGFWEMWVTEAMVEVIRPGMVVADIGANLGYFSLLMSDLVGPTGKVYAFEPNPEMALRLQRSLLVNGFSSYAIVHQVLLGRSDGEEMAFHVLDHEPGGGQMRTATADDANGDATMLTTCRLDSRPDWRLIEVAKIDVEGAEEFVLEGADELLSQSTLRTIFLEFMPMRYADPAGFIDRILSYGFGLEVVSPFVGIKPISREELLKANATEDLMLLLRR